MTVVQRLKNLLKMNDPDST